jgi:hypothetical protein
VAGRDVSHTQRLQDGLLVRTRVEGAIASGLERTADELTVQARRSAGDGDIFLAGQIRGGREQEAGIRMAWIVKERVHRPRFRDPSVIRMSVTSRPPP